MRPIGGFVKPEVADVVECVPFYLSAVVPQPISRLETPHAFYHIGARLEPGFGFSDQREDGAFVYVVCFGPLDNVAESLAAGGAGGVADVPRASSSGPSLCEDWYRDPGWVCCAAYFLTFGTLLEDHAYGC